MSWRWMLLGILAVAQGGCRPSRASQSAGHVGCHPSEITISDETVGEDGLYEGSENWVAECFGRRFICTEHTHQHVTWGQEVHRDSDVSCTPEYSQSAATSDSSMIAAPVAAAQEHEPPAAGGGFKLGAKVDEAQAACEGAGQQWQELSASQASCTGAVVPIGVPTKVDLGFCSGTLCRVELVHEPESDWLKVIAELRTKLESKYGVPGTRQGAVPQDCQGADAFVGCLKTRRVRLRYGWSWGSGQSLTLLIGMPLEGTVPAIRITYAGRGASRLVNESAL